MNGGPLSRSPCVRCGSRRRWRRDSASDYYEPGEVEVESRQGVSPEAYLPRSPMPRQLLVSQVLICHGPIRSWGNTVCWAEPTFFIDRSEAQEAQQFALKRGINVPSLLNFVTLHFSPTSDTHNIAQVLGDCPKCCRQLRFRRRLRPPDFLKEPLVGKPAIK